MKQKEMLYYGFHACMALFKSRKSDIIRVYCTQERVPEMGPILKWSAANKKAYHIVTNRDLENVTESVHHEGIVILAKRKDPVSEKELYAHLQRKRQPLVVLDDVVDPHNVGAIMRLMAHFGWPYLVCAKKDNVQLTSSAARVSEGGSEYVDFVSYEDQAVFLGKLKALDYLRLGATTDAKKSLYALNIPSKAFAFFLGNEVKGLSKQVASHLDHCVTIPSTGHVQSLNVAMAAGLVIGEYVRQRGL